jgi:hypothetical protein
VKSQIIAVPWVFLYMNVAAAVILGGKTSAFVVLKLLPDLSRHILCTEMR